MGQIEKIAQLAKQVGRSFCGFIALTEINMTNNATIVLLKSRYIYNYDHELYQWNPYLRAQHR